MCAPAALGVASFATGALGAVGQYQSGQAQAAAANANAQNTYRHQLVMYHGKNAALRNQYKQRQVEFQEQVRENNLAAQKAYANEQRRVNEAMRSAAFSKQSMMVDLLQKQGAYAASGMSGRSVDRLEGDIMSQFGRNQAVMSANLLNAQQAQTLRNESIRDQLRSQNNQAFRKVAVPPTMGIAPPAPVMQQGPSGLSLLAGLGSAAVSGYNTYNELKAPPVYGNSPTGANPSVAAKLPLIGQPLN